MAIFSREISIESRTFITAMLLISVATVTEADEPRSSSARLVSKPTASVSKAKQVQIERYHAQYVDEERAIETLAKEDRTALIKNVSNGMLPPPHSSDPVAETTFLMCISNRRVARLMEELELDHEANKTAEAIFDEKLRQLQESISTVIDSWERGRPPQHFLPIDKQSYAVCAGLILCMEHASLDDTLKRIDQWQSYGQLTAAKLRGLTVGEAALERLSTGRTQKLAESLRNDPQHLGRLLDNDVGRSARPESLFLVNVYIRLMQKHCQLKSVTAELPVYFQTQKSQVIPMWDWKSHPIASSLARQFVMEPIPEDRSLHSYTVYTGWGFLPDEQKQKTTTQVRECLERCRDENSSASEK